MLPPPRLSVINVGDGACSILDDGQRLLVLDCGSWRSPRGGREANALRLALGARVSRLHALVVSHFDQDHWKGLQALGADLAATRSQTVPVRIPDDFTIYYPGLSQRAEKVVAAYLILQSHVAGVSLRALDLKAAWTKVERQSAGPPLGRDVKMQPLFAGDHISEGNLNYQVLWPPHELGVGWNAKAETTLSELDELAPKIPGLQRKLKSAYGRGLWAGEGQAEARERAQSAEPLARYRDQRWDEEETEVPGISGEADSESDALEVPGHLEGPGVKKIPSEHLDRFKKLHDALADLNNHLSLVMHSVPMDRHDGQTWSWFLGLGDVQGWSLSRVLPHLVDHYSVALAPHHGTVEVPEGFPDVWRCVLQNGREHYDRRTAHTETHSGCRPTSTYEVGAGPQLHAEWPGLPWRRRRWLT